MDAAGPDLIGGYGMGLNPEWDLLKYVICIINL
jgi:hypothetical protein